MSVTVLIPRQLSRHLGHQREIAVDADNLKTMFEVLAKTYDLQDVFLTGDGHLQDFIRVIIEEQFVTSTRAEELSRHSVTGKTVEITTAFAGG